MVYKRVILGISIPENTSPTTFFHKIEELEKTQKREGLDFWEGFCGFFLFFSFSQSL
jgi:hypothetical protein